MPCFRHIFPTANIERRCEHLLAIRQSVLNSPEKDREQMYSPACVSNSQNRSFWHLTNDYRRLSGRLDVAYREKKSLPKVNQSSSNNPEPGDLDPPSISQG